MAKTGVILLNMGGPEQLDDVRPFLFNLFSDREIIKLGPPFMQKIIAWYIAKKRAPKSINLYRQIGGGSPLTNITYGQAYGLEKRLQEEGDYIVVSAMRYWKPTAETAMQQLEKHDIEQLIALPLYPHFSRATSGSSINDLQRSFKRSSLCQTIDRMDIISSYQDDDNYIQCLVSAIKEGIGKFPVEEEIQIVYSAHSLPVSFIEDGDPYVDHLKETIEKIEELTERKGILCYQSKSGPVEWLAPSTSDTIVQLGKQGCKNILVLPISFVSDHVETLYEIDIMFKQEALKLGIQLEMTRGLNTSPQFIETLAQLVLKR